MASLPMTMQQIEGNYDKFLAKVQERYGDKKDVLMKWADQWHQKSASASVGKSLAEWM